MELSIEFDFVDREYLRHGDEPLLARIYRPKLKGPLPCMVELHGGTWSLFDRTRGKALHETLARSGIVVVALDFRQGTVGAYPRSVCDINYGIRWVKANAAELHTRPDLVGISGNSSGAHLGMLVAMKPQDPKYSQIPMPGGGAQFDSGVRCVVMLWPVINPYGRYQYAVRLHKQPTRPAWADQIYDHHMPYWVNDENMKEGNPLLALERGEKLALPPALWIRSSQDQAHDYQDTDTDFVGTEVERFADRYRRAGGEIEIASYDAPMMFATAKPDLPESVAALRRAVDFIHAHIKP